MNPEDEVFIQSLNCYEDDYDVLVDNIQRLSGMLGLQIQLLQSIKEDREHEENVRHMTPIEQNISRMLNNFEQRMSIKFGERKERVNRFIYKESYDTGKMVKVGLIDEHNRIELYPPNKSTLGDKDTTVYTPTLYSTLWYVEPRGYEGTNQYLGIFPDDVKNTPQEIVVKSKRLDVVDKVTGYLTKEGKAIYYDQYNY